MESEKKISRNSIATVVVVAGQKKGGGNARKYLKSVEGKLTKSAQVLIATRLKGGSDNCWFCGDEFDSCA